MNKSGGPDTPKQKDASEGGTEFPPYDVIG